MSIGQFWPAFDLIAQDAILGSEVFNFKPKLFIDFARNPRQQLFPTHSISP